VDAIRDIKSFSSRYINENRLVKGHFEWQTGYGAFSYGQSQLDQSIGLPAMQARDCVCFCCTVA
jgi:hypothetical protein